MLLDPVSKLPCELHWRPCTTCVKTAWQAALGDVPTELNRSQILSGECLSPTETGSWFTTRFGPFESTGGYDWWKLAAGIEFPSELLSTSATPHGALPTALVTKVSARAA